MNTNEIKIQGIVKEVQPPVNGASEKGSYTRQMIVVELSPAKYKNLVCFNVWNEKVNTLKVGANITAWLSIEARSKDGKYLNSVTAFKVLTNKI